MDTMEGNVELQYAKEFWSLANVVTGFSIAQMIAYLLAVGATDSKIREGVIHNLSLVITLMIMAMAFYCGIVGILCTWQLELLGQQHSTELSSKMWAIAVARILAILGISILGLWVTWTLSEQPAKSIGS
jgi:hypothetical protein